MTDDRAFIFPRLHFRRLHRHGATIAAILVALLISTVLAEALPPDDPIDGPVWTWGNGLKGQLGNGHTTSISRAVASGSLGAIAVAAGADHTLALRSDGTVWGWGHNGYGQLGHSSIGGSESSPVLSNMLRATAISAGYYHSLALRFDGTVWAWGWGGYGQLGNGSFGNSGNPVQAVGLTGVIAIAAGGYHSMAIRSDGTVWTWGYGQKGALGTGTTQERNALPVQVPGLDNVAAISGGLNHGLALLHDGTVRSWGWNDHGQLGDGTKTIRTTPVAVSGINGVTSLAGGGFHSLATRSNGTVWAWGHGEGGALGTGALEDSTTPVQTSDVTGATKVAAGFGHSLALRTDGTVRAWGWGSSGQLGDGTMSTRYSPVLVIQQNGTLLPAVTDIAAGYSHSLSVRCGTSSEYATCLEQAAIDAQATCTAIGRWPQASGNASCTYVSGGNPRYVATTPDEWEIYTFRVINEQTVKVVLASGNLPGAGSIDSPLGEFLYLVIGQRCITAVGCGAHGILTVAG